MFNLSFGEILLIIILAILFLKPDDIPSIIHNLKKAFQKFMSLKGQFLEEIEDFKDEIKDIEDDLLSNDKIHKDEMTELKKDKKEKKDGK